MKKDISQHQEYQRLAKIANDLKYVLIKYGPSLGKALRPVQEEFAKYDRQRRVV